MQKRLGFVGLGAMGTPMVKNLLKAGFPVTVYDANAESARALGEAGARVAPDLATVCELSDSIITMLPNGSVVADVHEALYAHGHAGQVLIDMSTIAPAESRSLATAAEARGFRWLDAPVSGSVKPATDGTLVVLVGGDAAVYEEHKAVFAAMGKASIHFGPAGSGSVAKMVVNSILGVQIEILAEAVVLAEKNGLDRMQVLEMIGQAAVASPIVLMKIPMLLAGEYPRAFALGFQHKDLGLAINLAHQSGAVMPVTAAAHQVYSAAMGAGLAGEDVAAVVKQLEQMSGLR